MLCARTRSTTRPEEVGARRDLQLTVELPKPDPVHRRSGRTRSWAVLGVVAVVAGVLLYAAPRGNEEASASERMTRAAPEIPRELTCRRALLSDVLRWHV